MITPSECVHREQAEGRLAVDEDRVVLIDDRPQHACEDLLAPHFCDELHFRRGQVDVRRDDVEPVEFGVLDDLVHVDARVEQRGVDRVLERVRVDAEPHGRGALRVEVHDEHAAAVLGQRARDVDRARRFAYAALLVAHGDDPRRPMLPQRLRHRKGLVFSSKQIRRHTALFDQSVHILEASPPAPHAGCAPRDGRGGAVFLIGSQVYRFTRTARRLFGAWVSGDVGLDELVGADMRVDLRCLDRGMPQQLLHRAHIGAPLDQVRGE